MFVKLHLFLFVSLLLTASVSIDAGGTGNSRIDFASGPETEFLS